MPQVRFLNLGLGVAPLFIADSFLVLPLTSSFCQITPKFEELNRRAAIEDHRHRNAFRRRIRGSEDFLSLNRGLGVVYFKRI